MTRRWKAVFAAGIGAVALMSAAAAQDAPALRLPLSRSNAAPGRLIVKYRPQVSACAHCMLAKGIPFASVTGTDSLDRLNRELHVSGARALAFEQHDSKQRSADYLAQIAGARARFASRALRAGAQTSVPDLSNVYVLELPKGADVHAAAALYGRDPSVAYAQPDYEVEQTLIPNDPFFSSSGSWGQPYGDLWGLHNTDAATAWDTANGSGTVVAVIDTGVDYTHPDLSADMWQNPGEVPNNGIDDDGNGFVDDVRGWDFVDNANDPMDENGHGTHVAGTVAATGDNNLGVVGMAWGAKIMPVRGLNAQGRGYTSDLAKCILYAAQNGADVLNNSWGGFSFNLATGEASPLRDAVDTARALGVTIVAAAGNDSSSADFFEPAGYPGVIAVAATDYTDGRASFSNYGNAVSVAAPGVDVLSLRASNSGPIDPFGQVVASRYIRLNGTSMASPHAAGLSALLLSGQPGLTADELRWHLELNADQPGYAGYEGQAWNPYFGYGRINAGRVFDTPPVTTRLHGQADVHAYVDTVTAQAGSADFLFTTAAPVPWTLSSPPWLPPSAAAGSAAATVDFSADTSGLAPGAYSGTVVLDAPSAVDGGGSIAVALGAHADPRSGAIITLSSDYVADSVAPGLVPAVADGIGELVLWQQYTPLPARLYAARLDGVGGVHGPFVLNTNPFGAYHRLAQAAFDGRNFLVVWNNDENVPRFGRDRHRNTIMAMRIAPTGEALDFTPIELMRHEDFGNQVIWNIQLGFDGEEYTVSWTELNFGSGRGKTYARRIGTDGSLRGKAQKLFPRAQTRAPQRRWLDSLMTCAQGGCLLVWGSRSGASSAGGYYLDDAYAVHLVHGAIADTAPSHVLSGFNLGFGEPRVVARGGEYLVVGTAAVECGTALCGIDALGSRIAASGGLLATNARLNPVSPLVGVGGPFPAADASGYMLSFIGGGSRPGTQVFALRLDPSLQAVDTELPGALVLPQSLGTVPRAFGTSMAPRLTGSPSATLLTWVDTLNFDPNSATVTWTSPISVQRVFPQNAPAGLSGVAIGSIGARNLAERQTLTFALTAPALNAASTTFTATNLPAGAILDPSGIFRWTPSGTEGGSSTLAHFEAADGVQTAGEDVALNVVEAVPSLTGTVTLSGNPAVGIGIQISGGGTLRFALTDLTGHFVFEGLSPGAYVVKLDRASGRLYTSTPANAVVTMGAADRSDLNMTVTPR